MTDASALLGDAEEATPAQRLNATDAQDIDASQAQDVDVAQPQDLEACQAREIDAPGRSRSTDVVRIESTRTNVLGKPNSNNDR